MEKIICSICDSINVSFLYKKNNCNIYVCANCEAGFVWPIPSNIDAIYSENYFKGSGKENNHGYSDYDKDKESMKELFVKYLKKFEKLTNGRKIFDVGAATGYFLNIAKNRGWKTAGIEISNYASGIAISKGHNVICGDLKKQATQDKYSVVTMWDVLEHVDDPKEYLKIVNKILDGDGAILINTINRRSLLARVVGRCWHLIVPPEHLFYFSPKSLKILLESNGFKIKEIKTAGKKFSLPYIFKTLYNWQHLEFYNKLSKFFDKKIFRKIYIPINLRDNILIIAKKDV